ncbi:hypothetical protein LCGC14_0890750 [marine sediment metagenome]|uniref:Uncharacterized protein n=1 Tax=marine sediment metagenome TaxID=412755 RepID=A0A0F9NZD2_9ZZZZ
MAKRVVHVLIEMTVPYEEYSSKTKNDRAAVQICSRVREIARDELSFIPLRVDKEDGQYVDECSSKTKIVVKRSKPF